MHVIDYKTRTANRCKQTVVTLFEQAPERGRLARCLQWRSMRILAGEPPALRKSQTLKLHHY